MKKVQIDFVRPGVAELCEHVVPELKPTQVLVKTEYTLVSGGTERTCLLGMPNTASAKHGFPFAEGYCGIGYIEQAGEAVKTVKPGDRVLVYHGTHASYSVRDESMVTLVDNDDIRSLDAVFVIIASMGLGGVRKLSVELGESAMVMGLGLLGIFSIEFLRLSGANPVIAADPNPERRELALSLGADYALDPLEPGFASKVKELTRGKGVNAIVEVTGKSVALKQSLECASRMGRISLLGCTRVSDTEIDFYKDVHKPGVTLIGAHNMVRPKFESYPGHWTHQDDCRCILDLLANGRINISKVCSRVVSPRDCGEIYAQLANDPGFPIGTVFDWRSIDESYTDR